QQTPNRTPIPFVYTLDFSSDTATDLEIFFTISTAGGATRNFGISGYTIAAPVAPIPVPAALPLFLSGLGAFAALKGRKAINGTA
ncbi:MAG: VPLPA-CTERM sorting domain-containing protein, partial [Pseudomonadota bacterium]